jgi:uncharacterized delta-60 repeat protein
MQTMAAPNHFDDRAKPGDLDTTFADNGIFTFPASWGSIRSIAADSQGRLVLVAWASPEFYLCRILADGTLDRQFGRDGVTAWTFEPQTDSLPAKVMVQADGKILVLGAAGNNPNQRVTMLTRFNENGSPDLVFGNKIIPGKEFSGPEGCLQQDGKVLVLVVRGVDNSDEQISLLYRLQANGEIDREFFEQGFIKLKLDGAQLRGEAVTVTPDGRILVGVTARRENAMPLTKAVARFLPDGTLDHSFGRAGWWESEGITSLINIAADPQGIVCVGYHTTPDQGRFASISRLTPDGAYAPTFNNGQSLHIDIPADRPGYFVKCNSALVQTDGKIVVAGDAGFESHAFWLRLLPDGSLDPDFGEQGLVVHDRRTAFWDVHQQHARQRMLAAVDQMPARLPCVLGIWLGETAE